MPICNNVEKIDGDKWYWRIKKDKSLVYFNKPDNIYLNIDKIISNCKINEELVTYYQDEIRYLEEQIGKNWYVIDLLKRGIGIHHGKTPMYLQKFFESEYNNGKITTLLCTNTLMEGINTPTNSLFVVDDTRNIFELNNLMGRVGRLNPSNPKIGSIFICNDKSYEKYKDKDKWLDLTILAEDKTIYTNDEILFLNKVPTTEKMKKDFEIKMEFLKGYGIEKENIIKYNVCFDKVYKFASDGYIEKFKNAPSIHSCIDFSLEIVGKQIGNNFMINKFKGLESNTDYLPYKKYINDLLNNNSIKDIVNNFNRDYHNYDKSNINLLIDRLFDLKSFIKFKLSKMIDYFNLFNLNTSVNPLANYRKLLSDFSYIDNKSKIFNDLGIEENDYAYLATFVPNDNLLSTSKIMRIIKTNKEEIIKSNVSPFTKHNVSNL